MYIMIVSSFYWVRCIYETVIVHDHTHSNRKIENKSILSPNIYFTPPPITKNNHPRIDSIQF